MVNAALVGGCAAAGAVAGVFMDVLASRVPPHRASIPAPVSSAAGDSTAAGHAPLGAPPSAATLPAATVPGTTPSPDPPQAVPPPARPIPAERSVVVVVTAVLFAGAAARLGTVPELGAYCALFAGLVAVSVTDIRVGLVPRAFLYPTAGLVAAGLVAASAVDADWRPCLDALIGGAAAFGTFFAVWWLVPRSMGFGDVRLAGVIGLSLGWLGLRQVYLGFVVAFVVGSVVGVAKMVVQRTGRKTALPFGPALAAGAVVGVLWGSTLASLWFRA